MMADGKKEKKIREEKDGDEVEKDSKLSGTLDEIMENAINEDFPVTIQRLLSSYYSEIDEGPAKSARINKVLVRDTKKLSDYINQLVITNYRRMIEAETVEKMRRESNKMFKDIADKIEKLGTMDDKKPQKETDFALIIQSKGTDDIEEVRREIKQFEKDNENLKRPRDVIMTRDKQLILKLRNKTELQTYQKQITESEVLKSRVTTKISNRGRERMLLLGLEECVDESLISEALREVLGDDETEFEIIKRLRTKMGKYNWHFEVSSRVKERLLRLQRICVDWDRYKVVEYVRIIRCFRCQQYGHMRSNCQNEQVCPKCAGSHDERVCKVEEEKCINCYFNKLPNYSHRADSMQCPEYLSYRSKILPGAKRQEVAEASDSESGRVQLSKRL